MSRSIKILFTIILLSVVVLLVLIFSGSQIYTDWLWFKHLNFSGTFITIFFTNFWLRLLGGFIFAVFIFINLNFTKKPLLQYINIKQDSKVESLFGDEHQSFIGWANKKRINYLFLLTSIILGFLFSSISQDLWKIVLNYLNRSSFGIVDPIYLKDIGFYVFELPFFNFLQEMGMVLIILTLIVVGVIYTLASGISSLNDMKLKLSGRAKNHITILLVLFILLKAVSYHLSTFELLYSPRGVVFGAGYTDINANLLGLRILFYIAIIIGIFLLLNLFKKSYRMILWSLGIWLVISFIFGNIYPGFIQRFQVEPNEIAKESKYISYNIDMTMKAYGLDTLERKTFEIKNELTRDILYQNKATISNIRLWDARPLLSTYNQLQGLRPYYVFPNVDIDRYQINGTYQQVLLAARELDQNRLSTTAQTWINQTLKYTHGYGITMSPVNRVTTEGLPQFYIKDIPPKTNIELELTNPAVYYGEKTDNYVIVNTKSMEFDYPMGSTNAFVNYQGKGGVVLDNFFLKLIYAIRQNSIQILLADDITNESRILYYRNIKERVRKVAPFLLYDNDPYLVVAQGRLFWIQDAYTTTDRYPYSQPVNRKYNYIRNSIKIVIDAYNGNMNFYVIDAADPLVQTYQKIFPDLFTPGEKMPADLRKHLRYPQDLFMIQARLYGTYHMTDPTVFYNKEDLWDIPDENYADTSIKMRPYYIIMELPELNQAEFILMMPFTPINKNNMVAWMVARSDGENYGDILIYHLPKDKLIYGPMQIESRIDQNAEISQLLTLWGQRGSRVIRGNLLVIPIDNSILYVEPIYLQAETSELPELKRVVVAYAEQVVMEETLDQALNTIFGHKEELLEPIQEETGLEATRELPANLQELAQEALDVYQQAQQSLKEGNWTSYGELINRLEELLEKINQPGIN